jgi:hemerythrin
MRIEWSQDFSVGVEEIDSQHKALFERINHLDSAMKQGKAREEVARLIQFLDEYAAMHFGTEEKYMIDNGYAGYPHHKTQHNRFIEELSYIRNRLNAEGVTPEVIMLSNNLLIKWFSNHIRTVDRMLGNFLKSEL